MKTYKGFKVRIYPTKEQELIMWKHIHSCRFIWNYMLDVQIKNYESGNKYLGAFDMINLLKPLKNDGEHNWLYETSNTSLQIICQDLNKSYQSFFKKISDKPKFKSRKKAKFNFPVCSELTWFDVNGFVYIQKIGKVKYKTDFTLPTGKESKIINARISNKNGKWILSFNSEIENQDYPELNDDSIGIDLGIKEFATISFLERSIIFHNINKSKKMRFFNKKLIHLQRNISRKYEQNKVGNKYVKTNNILRLENQERKIYQRISDIRSDYIHKITSYLVSLHSKRIVIEDLNISGMMKNQHLSKAIQEQCFYEFRRQLEYKCNWNGIELIIADRFYPSSKTCSCCGNIKKDLKLSDRIYTCDYCNLIIDRDFNAALNLSRYRD